MFDPRFGNFSFFFFFFLFLFSFSLLCWLVFFLVIIFSFKGESIGRWTKGFFKHFSLKLENPDQNQFYDQKNRRGVASPTNNPKSPSHPPYKIISQKFPLNIFSVKRGSLGVVPPLSPLPLCPLFQSPPFSPLPLYPLLFHHDPPLPSVVTLVWVGVVLKNLVC